MKIINTIIIYILFYSYCFSQGEIIYRQTKSANDFNVNILEVKNDSIIYKYFGRTKKISLSSVIAYRFDYRQDSYIFPDPKEKEKYIISDGNAIKKENVKYELSSKNKNGYVLKVLKKYLITNCSFDDFSKGNRIFLCKKDSSKVIKASTNRRLFIIMKNDSLNIEMTGKIWKILNDSIIYFAYKSKKDTCFYAIKKCDIKYIGIESQKSFNTRVMLGVFSGILSGIPPLILIPIKILSTPILRKYDIENTWDFVLLENKIGYYRKPNEKKRSKG